MLGIRVNGKVIALTASFPKALSYVAHIVAACPASLISSVCVDANIPSWQLAHWEHMQLSMDDYSKGE
jgi:hypothetical protein